MGPLLGGAKLQRTYIHRYIYRNRCSYIYTYIYTHIYTSVLLCISMHRESGYDSEVDPIVKYIKSIRWTQFGKVWKAIHTRVHTPWNCHELPIDGKATVYGQSVTDACIWEETESTLDGIARAVNKKVCVYRWIIYIDLFVYGMYIWGLCSHKG